MENRTRIALSLKPDIDLVISDLARLTKQTKTSVINGILKDMYPVLKKTAFAIEKAQQGQDKLSLSLMKDLTNEAETKFKEAQFELDQMIGESNGNK